MTKPLALNLVLTLLVLLILSACGTPNPAPAPAAETDLQAAGTVTKRIASGADDTEEVADGAVFAPSERLEIVKTLDRGNQLVGLRFTDLAIPKGARITNAQLFFTAERATSAPTNVTVKGLKDAKPFPTTKNYLSSAAKTTALNTWPPNAWTQVGVTDAYKTGNISNIVQELVSASSWQSGNALAFVIYGGNGDRSAESFEGNPKQAVRLLVEYSIPDKPSNPEAVPIIFDTDFGFDVDDVGALAVLNALENNGEANILAVMAVTTDLYTPGAIDAVNTYYNNPNIPIGQNKEAPDKSKWDTACPYWKYKKDEICAEQTRYFVDDLASDFPNTFNTPEKAKALPSAVDLYRKTLAAQPDNSVTVVAVGFMQNLDNLLASKADTYSTLNGKDLVKKKVKQLVIMGASYPSKGTDTDFNLTGGRVKSAGQRVLENWPTTIAFTPGNYQMCGADDGKGVSAGNTLSDNTPKANPVRKAYELFSGVGKGRDAWDLCSVLYGVRGTGFAGQAYFEVFKNEKVVLKESLDHDWVAPGNDRHVRVWRGNVISDSKMEAVLNGLLTQPPK